MFGSGIVILFMGGSGGEGGSGSGPLENYNLLKVTLGSVVRTPLEKQLDPSGPIASRGRSVRPSLKNVNDQTNNGLSGCQGPLAEFSSESTHAVRSIISSLKAFHFTEESIASCFTLIVSLLF